MITFIIIYSILYVICVFILRIELLQRWNSYPECLDPNSKPPGFWSYFFTYNPLNVVICLILVIVGIIYGFITKKKYNKRKDYFEEANKIIEESNKLR